MRHENNFSKLYSLFPRSCPRKFEVLGILSLLLFSKTRWHIWFPFKLILLPNETFFLAACYFLKNCTVNLMESICNYSLCVLYFPVHYLYDWAFSITFSHLGLNQQVSCWNAWNRGNIINQDGDDRPVKSYTSNLIGLAFLFISSERTLSIGALRNHSKIKGKIQRPELLQWSLNPSSIRSGIIKLNPLCMWEGFIIYIFIYKL